MQRQANNTRSISSRLRTSQASASVRSAVTDALAGGFGAFGIARQAAPRSHPHRRKFWQSLRRYPSKHRLSPRLSRRVCIVRDPIVSFYSPGASQVKPGEIKLWRTILENSPCEGSRRLFLSTLLPLFPLDPRSASGHTSAAARFRTALQGDDCRMPGAQPAFRGGHEPKTGNWPRLAARRKSLP